VFRREEVKMISKYIFIILLTAKSSFALINPSIEFNEYSYFESQCVCKSGTEEDIKSSIQKTNEEIEKTRIAQMIPGLVAGISIKGKTVWTEAFGQTDIENDVKTRTDSVWRMASISKSLTTALVAKLMEKGLIDLEKSIHYYLSTKIFPIKQWKEKNVTITVKQVMSHTAGLRDPYDIQMFGIFNNVTQHVVQFNGDPFNSEPGSKFEYSTYGFQIIGAIIESVLNDTFENAINKMFKELGMNSTFAERREKIIPHRVRDYMKSTSPYIRNSLNPKNSTKVEILNALIQDELVPLVAIWPAAGLVSTVPDLLKFGNYMLNSYKGVIDSKSGTGMKIR
jgi:CubicO group peptidase (beta-lactamase class C family)